VGADLWTSTGVDNIVSLSVGTMVIVYGARRRFLLVMMGGCFQCHLGGEFVHVLNVCTHLKYIPGPL
jgi:hypothetical protein